MKKSDVDFKSLDKGQLKDKKRELQGSLFAVKLKLLNGELKDLKAPKKIKKDIARVNFYLSSK